MNLIPMKDSDYAAYLTNAVFKYANDKVQAGTWAKDEALALAKESFASLLPQGTATENNHLFSLFAADFNEPIGVIWVNTAAQKAFIYDFIIEEDQRGKAMAPKRYRLWKSGRSSKASPKSACTFLPIISLRISYTKKWAIWKQILRWFDV